MGTLTINGSSLGNGLQSVLTCADIQPGDTPSYETCKRIYLLHPLGAKMVEKPVQIAQSQKRKITVPDGPEDMCKEAFDKQWKKDKADRHIRNCLYQSRIYGIASLAALTKGKPNESPLDMKTLWRDEISFNVYDPLNTAGSLVLNQDPLAMDFQHAQEIEVNGSRFHRSRARVVMNEDPIYISYTPSAFGFSGRSCYQRSLYPLKSYIQTMITNDMVSVKAGVIVAKIKQAGSFITGPMMAMFGLKRDVVQEAKVGNVISIGDKDEAIESIDLKNLSEPFGSARKFIIEDIASGAKMPARMLTEESFAEGFGEGSEDAKAMARYVQGVREEADPLYEFMDGIVMRRAWNPDFYKLVQERFPEEYKGIEYDAAFFRWSNSFNAEWPNLLEEPDSEKAKSDKVKLDALIAVLSVLMPKLSPDNLALVVEWMADNINEMKQLFGSPLNLDYEDIATYEPPAIGDNGGPPLDEDDDGEPEAKPRKPREVVKNDSAEDAIAWLAKAARAHRMKVAA